MKNKYMWDSSSRLVKNNKSLRVPIIVLAIGMFFMLLSIWIGVCFYGIMMKSYEPSKQYLVMYYEKHEKIFNYPELDAKINDKENIQSYAIRYSCVDDKTSEEIFHIDGKKIVSRKKSTIFSDKIPGENIKYYSDKEHTKVVGYSTCIQIVDNIASKNKISIAVDDMIIKGDTFKNDGKKQVLVSERFLTNYNIRSNIVGSKMSLQIDYSNLQNLTQIIDNDTIVGNNVNKVASDMEIKIFQDFEIVGVFANEILEYNNDSDLIISINSVDFKKFPVIENQVFTYLNSDYEEFSQTVTKNGEFFPFMQNNMYISSWYETINNKETASRPVLLYEAQLSSFSEAIKIDSELSTLRKTRVFSSPLSEIIEIYKIGKLPTIIFAVLGLIFLIPVSIKLSKFNLVSEEDRLAMFKIKKSKKMSYQKIYDSINFQVWNIFARALSYAVLAIFIITCVLVFVFKKMLIERFLNYFVLAFIINFLIAIIVTVLLLSVVRFFIKNKQRSTVIKILKKRYFNCNYHSGSVGCNNVFHKEQTKKHSD